MERYKPHSRSKAFTLIELMIVIGIFSVLMAILLPVLTRTKAAAGDAKSLSNLMQLGAAFQLYGDDYDGCFPQATDGEPGEGLAGGWVFDSRFGNLTAWRFDIAQGSLFSYNKTPAIYISAADADAGQSRLTFAMNGFLTTWTGAGLNPGKFEAAVP